MSSKKVLIAAPVHPVLTNGLRGMGYECVLQEQIQQEQAAALMADCEGVITSTRLYLGKELLDAAPLLRWIGRMGSGMEVIDTAYAAQKGVYCTSSPEGNCNAVAEHAVGMLLAVLRRIPWSHAEMKEGIWKREENRGHELEGKTIGIVGYGHTGAALARRLAGFDVRVLAYDKYHLPTNVPTHVTICSTLQPIYEEAHVVSFHVPLQHDTVHYFNNEFLGQMQQPFLLLNTSRGPVVSTHALYEGLLNKKIIGAALDVFEKEPVTKMDKEMWEKYKYISLMDNVVTTPHIAGYTHEALYKMSETLLQKLGKWHAETNCQ